MQVITIGSLLESAIPCSSSTKFLSNSPSDQHANSPGLHQPVLASDVVQEIRRKRSRDKQGVQAGSSSKKLKAKCQSVKVLPHFWTIVGRLQLCNRNLHRWNDLYVPADCVALTDSTATICCCISQGPDPRLLGKIVRMNSWSFIPKKGMQVTDRAKAGDLCVDSLTRIGSTEVPGVQGFPNFPALHVNPARIPSSAAENGHCRMGILEVYSLEVVEDQPSEDSTLPSLFVTPTAADSRRVFQESPLIRQERKERALVLRGVLQSISPPFILPCKYSLDRSVSPSRARISTVASGVQERSNGRPPKEPMLGFFVEIQFCPCCSPLCIDSWKKPIKRERHRPQKVDEREELACVSEPSPTVSSKTEPSVTIEQGSVCDDFSSSLRAVMPRMTPDPEKRFEPEWSSSRVYFSGSVAAWRPVLSGALGRCVTVTGLGKKLILVGSEKKPYTVFLATRQSLIILDRGRELVDGNLQAKIPKKPGATNMENSCPFIEQTLESKRRGTVRIDVENCEEKKLKNGVDFESAFDHVCAVELSKGAPPGCDQAGAGVCMEGVKCAGMDNRVISFVGVVTDVLFQGLFVELDESVWLLLTHQRHTKLHGLRVGVMLSLRNVHGITVKDLTGKSLLLGACMQSHVSVMLFSPLLTLPAIQVSSKSILLKYIQSLSFTSTFWLLSLIGSFRQKLCDIYSNKELLGSKTDPGIIQKYAEKVMAPAMTLERDAFMEFFFHQHFCRLGDRLPFVIQVPPISIFCEHVEALWQTSTSLASLSNRRNSLGGWTKWAEKRSPSLQSSTSGLFSQLIIASQEIGITLLGSLQVCLSSGKLQLMDASGIVDVIIPDLISTEHLSRTYQVSRFTVVVEGLRDASAPASMQTGASSNLWSNLLKEVKADARLSEAVKYCVHFFMRDATHLHDLDRRENAAYQTGLPHHEKGKRQWQKQMQDRWAKTKVHLDSVRVWFQALAVADVCSSGHGVKLLCEHVGALAHSDCLFKVNCKVVAVRLLVFESQGGRAISESWPQVKCPTLNQKVPSGIPLTLACFVVDDGSGPVDCWALGDAAVSLLGVVKMAAQLRLPGETLERMCMNFGKGSDLQSFMQVSLEQLLCYVVQRHGQIVLQNESAWWDLIGSRYWMCGNGGKPLDEDEQTLLHAVVASSCHNGFLVVVGGNIPSVEKICSVDCTHRMGQCKVLTCSKGCSGDPSLDHSPGQLMAHRVESRLWLTDLKTMSEQVARLLKQEKFP